MTSLAYDPNLTALLHLVFGAATVGIIAFIGLIYVRSHLVFTCRHRALELCNQRILALACEWEHDETLQACIKPQTALKLIAVLEDYPSYDEMWRDTFKWSFEDFYPDIYQRLLEKQRSLGWHHTQ